MSITKYRIRVPPICNDASFCFLSDEYSLLVKVNDDEKLYQGRIECIAERDFTSFEMDVHNNQVDSLMKIKLTLYGMYGRQCSDSHSDLIVFLL